MGVAIVLSVGAILGWLASIVTRTDARQDIVLNIIVGTSGALIAGLLAGGPAIINMISATALLCAFLGSLTLLAVVNLCRDHLSADARDHR